VIFNEAARGFQHKRRGLREKLEKKAKRGYVAGMLYVKAW
jgi:hypothetical protein